MQIAKPLESSDWLLGCRGLALARVPIWTWKWAEQYPGRVMGHGLVNRRGLVCHGTQFGEREGTTQRRMAGENGHSCAQEMGQRKEGRERAAFFDSHVGTLRSLPVLTMAENGDEGGWVFWGVPCSHLEFL
jgi:hypothetical protein